MNRFALLMVLVWLMLAPGAASAATIQVTAPNGYERWNPNGLPAVVPKITWVSSGVEKVSIDLYKGGIFLKSIAVGVPAAGGTYTGYGINNMHPVGGDFRVRVRSFDSPTVFDESDRDFVIRSNSSDTAIAVVACVQKNPVAITLKWSAYNDNPNTYYEIFRRPLSSGGGSWGSTVAGGSVLRDGKWVPVPGGLTVTASSWTDTAVTPGTVYEYKVIRNGYAEGVVSAGINLPLTDSRGSVILLVDETMAVPLAAELLQTQRDLVGDGWKVIMHNVPRKSVTDAGWKEAVVATKALIQADCKADANVKAIYIIGHVAIPYSGNLNPDGHVEHKGAWPADGYYGDLSGSWTDVSVNTDSVTGTIFPNQRNVPGDGKFDQTVFPVVVSIAVGRVDLFDMPAFSLSETELLRQYLQKNHSFRHSRLPTQPRVLIDENFNEAFARSGYWWGGLVGGDAGIDRADYITALRSDGNFNPGKPAYLFACGTGGGGHTSCAGIARTKDVAYCNPRAVITGFFGSYFGDWDHTDNFLRSPLATSTGLISFWASRPDGMFHALGMGQTTGFAALMNQNARSSYSSAGYGQGMVHISLLGDPTLRLHIVPPVSNLTQAKVGSSIRLSWSAAADSGVVGYHVYRATSALGPFTRITGTAANTANPSGLPITVTTYTDMTAAAGIAYTYMVRAVKNESGFTAGGCNYFNLSQGAFITFTPPAVPTVTWANPANITYGTALSNAQCAATANVPGSFVYTPALGSILNAGNAQAISVIFTPTDTSKYTSATKTVALTVLKKALTVTALNASRVYGSANPSFAASYAGFVPGESATKLVGTLAFACTATTTSAPGSYPITLGGLTSANYAITFVVSKLTVMKANQAITFATFPVKTYGDTAITLGATASSGLAVSYTSSNHAVATVSGSKLTITGAGTAIITASQPGNANYNPAAGISRTLSVGKKALSVRANDKTRLTGQANPDFDTTSIGLVNGDTEVSISLDVFFTCAANSSSPAGSYPILVSGTLPSATNYAATYQSGKLTVKISEIPLVAYWPFDEVSGTTLTDLSGAGHNGTLANMNTFSHAPGIMGKSLVFDGIDDVVTIPNALDLEVGKNNADFSVMFWIRLDQNATGQWRSVMQKGGDIWQRTFSFFMEPATNRIHYSVNAQNAPYYGANRSSTTELPIGKWTHVAMVKQGKVNRLYINGLLDAELTLPGDVISNSGPLYLGKLPFSPSWCGGTSCGLDDLRVFNRALSDGDVASTYVSVTSKLVLDLNFSAIGAQSGILGKSLFIADLPTESYGEVVITADQANANYIAQTLNVDTKNLVIRAYDVSQIAGQDDSIFTASDTLTITYTPIQKVISPLPTTIITTSTSTSDLQAHVAQSLAASSNTSAERVSTIEKLLDSATSTYQEITSGNSTSVIQTFASAGSNLALGSGSSLVLMSNIPAGTKAMITRITNASDLGVSSPNFGSAVYVIAATDFTGAPIATPITMKFPKTNTAYNEGTLVKVRESSLVNQSDTVTNEGDFWVVSFIPASGYAVNGETSVPSDYSGGGGGCLLK